jgi:iron(III) transport system permease protein
MTAAVRSGWTLAAALVCAPVALPLAAVALSFATLDAELWAHFAQYVLPEVSANTAWLLLGVGFGVSLLGSALAALVALSEFPGRRFFSWALLLPLAAPGYVLATAYVGLFDAAGVPEWRGRGGVIGVLVLALYPYVYLVARNAFATTGAHALEAARMLGHPPLAAFARVVLPLAAPWIAGGTLLALMETLADFGAVSAFNYDTLTTALYKAWFGLFAMDLALQLAALLLLAALALRALESRVRGARGYTQSGAAPALLQLGGARWLATAVCTLVLLAALGLPLLQLLAWSARHLEELDLRLLRLAGNSLALGLAAAALTAGAALLLAYAARQVPGRITRALTSFGTLGYAFPGPLLALGLYAPYAAAVQWLNGDDGTRLAQGGLGLLLLAYLARFLAVAHAPVSSGLLRVTRSLDEAARLHGITGLRQLRQVHLPLITRGTAAAALLVMVDVMKEMPATLMMRPFGWDTLAVRVFEFTSEGEWSRAALPSLLILLAGLGPVLLLNKAEPAHASAT